MLQEVHFALRQPNQNSLALVRVKVRLVVLFSPHNQTADYFPSASFLLPYQFRVLLLSWLRTSFSAIALLPKSSLFHLFSHSSLNWFTDKVIDRDILPNTICLLNNHALSVNNFEAGTNTRTRIKVNKNKAK